MARRRRAEKREVTPDSRYGSKTVTLLVNFTMRQGKKSLAEKIIYGAFDKLAAEKQGSDPLEILERAVSNARPRLEVKSRRVGGATYHKPADGIGVAMDGEFFAGPEGSAHERCLGH